MKVLRNCLRKPFFIPGILFICVTIGIIFSLFLTMPITQTVSAGIESTQRIIILDAGHGELINTIQFREIKNI